MLAIVDFFYFFLALTVKNNILQNMQAKNNFTQYKQKARIGDAVWKLACAELGYIDNGTKNIYTNEFMSRVVLDYNIQHPDPKIKIRRVSVHTRGSLFEAFVYDVYKNFGLNCVMGIVKELSNKYNLSVK